MKGLSMFPFNRHQALAHTSSFKKITLWLALGVSFAAAASGLLACQSKPQPQALAHAIFVSYWSFKKPVKTPNDLIDNSAVLLVSAMDANTGRQTWQTTIFDVPDLSKTPSSNAGLSVSSITPAGPYVYVVATNALNGFVAALDASTGSILWKAQEPKQINTLQVANGLVFVQMGSHTTLQVLDGQSGKVLWHRSTEPNYLINSLALTRNAVYILEESFLPTSEGQAHVFLLALQAGNGAEIWRGSVEHTNNTVGYQIQADAERVYLLRPSHYDLDLSGQELKVPGEVVALRARDGSPLWTTPEPRFLESDYVYFEEHTLFGQTLYLVDFAGLTALNVQDGKLLWTYTAPLEIIQFIPNTRLYGLSKQENEHLCSFHVNDGTKQWCTSINPLSLVIAGKEQAYFLGYQDTTSGEKLMVLRQSDGQVVHQYQIGDQERTQIQTFAVVE
jgi:outer membrane protein assembly factor BamB